MSKPSLEYVTSRLSIDPISGTAVWIDATKHHAPLNGANAGTPRANHSGKRYWYIKIDNKAYKRSHLMFLVTHGRWPQHQIDHIDGNSLNDKASNLREATATQNAWNHKRRAKKSSLPMGVRLMPQSGRFQARIACEKKVMHLGTYATPDEAHKVYLEKRKELFGDFA